MRKFWLFLVLALVAPMARAQFGSFQNNCEVGGTTVTLSGMPSTNKVQGSWPGCLVTVYAHGTSNLATIYSDNGVTPLTNPFTANTTTGNFIFYATTFQSVDVVIAKNPAIPSTSTMPTFTYSNVQTTGGGGQPLFCTNGKNTPGVDDSAALNAAIALAYAYSATITSPYASGPTVSTCGGKSYFGSTLNLPMNLIYDQFNVQALTALGANTGLRFYNAGISAPAGAIQNSTISGAGSGTTGSLMEFLGTVGFSLKNDNITEHGGKCVNIANSERMTIDSATEIGPCASDVNIFGSSNEIFYAGKATNNGSVNAIEGNPAYVYSVNATNGVWPSPNTGPAGTLTPIFPENYHAALTIDGAADFHMVGPGSTKGSQNSPMVWDDRANATLDGLYCEQSHGSPCLISGGPVIYTATTAALTTTNVAVSASSSVYNAQTGAAVATFPTNLYQHYWYDSVSDAAAAGNIGTFCFYPSDFVKNSTTSSTIGGGILKGQFLCYAGAGYAGVSSPSLQLISLTPTSGCSNPSADPATTCTAHSALTWPAGALTGEIASGATMAVENAHINGIDSPASGYAFSADNTTALTSADVVCGSIPDPYQVPQGAATGPSSCIMRNDEMFSGFTHDPGVGLFWAHTNAIIDLSGQNVGAIPATDDDTLSSVYLDPYFSFGPNGVGIAQYPNGSSAQLILRDAGGERTVSNNQGVLSENIAVTDPTTQITTQSQNCVPGCSTSTRPAQIAVAAPSVVPTGGSIAAPTNGQAIAVSVAYINSTAYTTLGYEAPYTNVTFSNNGSGWTVGPKVTMAGTKTATITAVTLNATGNFASITTSGSNSFATNDPVTLTGMQNSTADVALNAQVCTVTSTGNPFICQLGVTVSNLTTSPEVGQVMVSYCSGWSTTGQVTSGSIYGIGNTSSANPGAACTMPPGTTENLIFSRAGTDTTGTGTAAQIVLQGSYGSASPAQPVYVASGTTNSISVPSPPADPDGTTYFIAYVGPQGQQYGYPTLGTIGSPLSVTSINYAPTSATVSFMPRDCAYECNPDSLVGFTNDQTFNFRHWNAATNRWVDDAVYTPSGFTFYAPVNLPSGAGVRSINGVAGAFTFSGSGVNCITTACTFSGGSSGLTSINSQTGPAITIAAGGGIAVTNPSSNNITIAATGTAPAHFWYYSLQPTTCNYFNITWNTQADCTFFGAWNDLLTNNVTVATIWPGGNFAKQAEWILPSLGTSYGTPTIDFWGMGAGDVNTSGSPSSSTHIYQQAGFPVAFSLYHSATGPVMANYSHGVWFDGNGQATVGASYIGATNEGNWEHMTITDAANGAVGAFQGVGNTLGVISSVALPSTTGWTGTGFCSTASTTGGTGAVVFVQVAGGTPGTPTVLANGTGYSTSSTFTWSCGAGVTAPASSAMTVTLWANNQFYSSLHEVDRNTANSTTSLEFANSDLTVRANGNTGNTAQLTVTVSGGVPSISIASGGSGYVNQLASVTNLFTQADCTSGGAAGKCLPVELVAAVPARNNYLACQDEGLYLAYFAPASSVVSAILPINVAAGCTSTTTHGEVLDNPPYHWGANLNGASDALYSMTTVSGTGMQVYARAQLTGCSSTGSVITVNYSTTKNTMYPGESLYVNGFAGSCNTLDNGVFNITTVGGGTITFAGTQTANGSDTGYGAVEDIGWCSAAGSITMDRLHDYFCEGGHQLGGAEAIDYQADTNINIDVSVSAPSRLSMKKYINQGAFSTANSRMIGLLGGAGTTTIDRTGCTFSSGAVGSSTGIGDIFVNNLALNSRPDRLLTTPNIYEIHSDNPCPGTGVTPVEMWGGNSPASNIWGIFNYTTAGGAYGNTLGSYVTTFATSSANFSPAALYFHGSAWSFSANPDDMVIYHTIGTGTNPAITDGIVDLAPNPSSGARVFKFGFQGNAIQQPEPVQVVGNLSATAGLFATGGLGVVTGISGGTFSGTGTLFLTAFNGGCTGSTVTVNVLSGVFTNATITAAGTGCTTAPTSATCTSGTATCTGSPVSITVATAVNDYDGGDIASIGSWWDGTTTQTSNCGNQQGFTGTLTAPQIVDFFSCTSGGSPAGFLFEFQQPVQINGSLNLDQTITSGVACATSGTVDFTMPFQGPSYKKVLIYFHACQGAVTAYTFPISFSNTPGVFLSTAIGSLASVGATVSTTAITVSPTSALSGPITLESY